MIVRYTILIAAVLLLAFSASAAAGPFSALPDSFLRAGVQVESLIAEINGLARKKMSQPRLSSVEQGGVSLANTVVADLQHLKSINAALMNNFLLLNTNPPEDELAKLTKLTLSYMKDVALPQCRRFRTSSDLLATSSDPQFAFMGKKISQVFSRYIVFLEKGIDLLQESGG